MEGQTFLEKGGEVFPNLKDTMIRTLYVELADQKCQKIAKTANIWPY